MEGNQVFVRKKKARQIFRGEETRGGSEGRALSRGKSSNGGRLELLEKKVAEAGPGGERRGRSRKEGTVRGKKKRNRTGERYYDHLGKKGGHVKKTKEKPKRKIVESGRPLLPSKSKTQGGKKKARGDRKRKKGHKGGMQKMGKAT